MLQGLMASFSLLIIYFVILTLVSGWSFTLDQFFRFWYFVVTLAIGFGIQVGLYSYLKSAVKNISIKVITTSGITSSTAMISCCVHYLVNLLPILGTVGIITLISQYQVELFWIGLIFNFGGIVYMVSQISKLKEMT